MQVLSLLLLRRYTHHELSFNQAGENHGTGASATLEQRSINWAKATTEAKGYLDHPYPSTKCKRNPRFGSFQSRH
jgi:hypothetical protein